MSIGKISDKSQNYGNYIQSYTKKEPMAQNQAARYSSDLIEGAEDVGETTTPRVMRGANSNVYPVKGCTLSRQGGYYVHPPFYARCVLRVKSFPLQ